MGAAYTMGLRTPSRVGYIDEVRPLVVALALLAGVACAPSDPPREAPVHAVVILVDTLRADVLMDSPSAPLPEPVPNDSNKDRLAGGLGNDTLHGMLDHDVLVAGDGNDHADGGSGNDWIEGGNGDDQLHGGLGGDVVFGGRGNDTISGGRGNDGLVGGSDHDKVAGNEGHDWVFGDQFTAADVVYGGTIDFAVQFGWLGEPTDRVRAYVQRIKARPAYRASHDESWH